MRDWCFVCNKLPAACATGRLLTCGGCKLERYCSKACQKSAWKSGHKGVCSGLAACRAGHDDVLARPDLFQKYSAEWIRRLTGSLEFAMILGIVLPSAKDASDMFVTLKCDWDPSAPDGSKFVIGDRLAMKSMDGHRESVVDASRSFQWARENLGKLSNEKVVGVMCRFMFANGNAPGEAMSFESRYEGTGKHVALSVRRSNWDDPHVIELREEAETAIPDGVAILNQKYGKQLHKER